EIEEKEINVIDIFNKEILCFNSENFEIDKKSKLLVKSENHFPSVFYANILDIQYEKKSIERTKREDRIDIGIKVDKKIKKTMSFKLLSA
ncbi:MAG: hypothetical protein COA80_12745, partial [Leeuwenhoekiella sp.]